MFNHLKMLFAFVFFSSHGIGLLLLPKVFQSEPLNRITRRLHIPRPLASLATLDPRVGKRKRRSIHQSR